VPEDTTTSWAEVREDPTVQVLDVPVGDPEDPTLSLRDSDRNLHNPANDVTIAYFP
jgi:hypothetical protein